MSITAATATVKAGQAHLNEFQGLLDACVDAVIIINHLGIIETFNHAAERMFGYAPAEVLGRNISLLMPDPDRSQHDGYLARYLASHEAHVIGIGREVEALKRDGSVFPVSLAVGEIPASSPPRFVGFLRDLTARKHAEAERRRAEDAVREARDRLMHVARLSTMGELANGLAHELNQPLTAIANYSQAAARLAREHPEEGGEVIAALDHITTQALRAGEVIKRLRALVRHRDTREELLDVNMLVQELTVLAEADARSSRIRLTTDLEPALPPVLADAVQLQQVMLNLIRNAIEAVQPAAARSREIVLRTRKVGAAEVELSVCDFGPGIPPDLRERIFDPFFTTKEEGTGLGLAISKSIVENHGGKLAWRPSDPEGSCFYFRLPAMKPSP